MLKLAILFLYAAQALALASDLPVVDLGYAQYQGVFDRATNVTNFLGIRYAAAPVGTSIQIL